MISILTVATLVYAAILVLALAVVLSIIAIQLWRIAAALGETRDALRTVAERTAPLKGHLGGLTTLTEENVHRIDASAASIARSLEALLEPAEAATR